MSLESNERGRMELQCWPHLLAFFTMILQKLKFILLAKTIYGKGLLKKQDFLLLCRWAPGSNQLKVYRRRTKFLPEIIFNIRLLFCFWP